MEIQPTMITRANTADRPNGRSIDEKCSGQSLVTVEIFGKKSRNILMLTFKLKYKRPLLLQVQKSPIVKPPKLS